LTLEALRREIIDEVSVATENNINPLQENYVYTHEGFNDGLIRKYSLRDIRQFYQKYQLQLKENNNPARTSLVEQYILYWKNAEKELDVKKWIGSRSDRLPTEDEIYQIHLLREEQKNTRQQIKKLQQRNRKLGELAPQQHESS